MKFWIDAQLPPSLANWLSATFSVEAAALRDLGLRDAKDEQIFSAAQKDNVVIMTKDSDFVDLVCRLGAPPKIIWITCGNITNRNLRKLLSATFEKAITQLQAGANIVEIGDQ